MNSKPDLQTLLDGLTPDGQKKLLFGLSCAGDSVGTLADEAFEKVKERGLLEDLAKIFAGREDVLPQHRGVYTKLAVAFEERQDYALALRFLKVVDPVSVHPDSVRLNKRLGELYEQQGVLEQAAKHYRAAENLRKAQGLELSVAAKLEAEGDIAVAAEFYESGGSIEKAFALYIKIAEEHEKSGNLDDAHSYFGRARNVASIEMARFAADEKCYELSERIAQRYEQKGEFALAGTNYAEAGNLEKAAECFERAGQLGRAATERVLLEQFSKAQLLYERAGRFDMARDCAASLGYGDKAALYQALFNLVGFNDNVAEEIGMSLPD